MADLEEVRLHCAAKIAALADALRNIPVDLKPHGRASLVALREQIYYGWERQLALAVRARLLFGKYEIDGWWSEAAAALVRSGAAQPGRRQLERDHVEPVSRVVADILETPRTTEETAALLEGRLITCTVLAEEHRRLSRAHGVNWDRYFAAGIRYHWGVQGGPSVWDERNGPEDFDDSADGRTGLDRIHDEPTLHVGDVATLLHSGRVTFDEAKVLLGKIEMEISQSLTWEEQVLGADKTYLENDPIHLDWLTLGPNGLSYQQLSELKGSMKPPRE